MPKFEIGSYVDVFTDEGDFLAVGKVVNYNGYRESSMAYAVNLITFYPDHYFVGDSRLKKNNDDETTIEKLEFFIDYMKKRRGENR